VNGGEGMEMLEPDYDYIFRLKYFGIFAHIEIQFSHIII
jgi:hypothetical protein